MWRLGKMSLQAMFVCFVIQLAIVGAARAIGWNNRHDPLDPFEVVMPGHGLPATSPSWCGIYVEHYGKYTYEDVTRICEVSDEQKTVQLVSIYVRDNVIQSTAFQISGNLHIGDLAALWGSPITEKEGAAYYPYVRWDRGGYAVRIPLRNRHFSYWLSVDYITVADAHALTES